MNFKLDFSNVISSNIGEEHGIKYSDIESLAGNKEIFDALEEKIQNAPDKGYEIGVFIGSILPFLVLAVIAYFIYYFNKKD